MINLAKYFEKFKLLDRTFGSKVGDIQSAVEQAVGVHLEPNSIQIKEGKAYINTSPAIRNEILMNKQQILDILQSKNIKIEIY